MDNTSLVTHCGARQVSLDELSLVVPPPPTETWFPVSHAAVLRSVKNTLGEAGFSVKREQLALNNQDHRFFGTLDLISDLAPGVSLAVGIRNSTDKSLPIGFCAGNRVFVCDNLAFRSEVTVSRKHTKFGETRYMEALALAVQGLVAFKKSEQERIFRFQETDIDDTKAESLILRAYEKDVISTRTLPNVLAEWRKPTYPELEERTLWGLFNAFTTVLGGRAKTQPQDYASKTILLNDLLGTEMSKPVIALAS